MSEGKITIFNGEQWRPFIHVEDVCRAFRMALVAPLDLVSGQVFNAGSSFMNFTLRQLADTIEHMEPGLEVEYVDNEDKRNYRVSFERIRRELGFQCHVGLETGVRGLQEALRRGLVKDYTEPVYNNYKTLLAQITHANGHQAEPEADLLARQFSQKSIWWNLNHSNGSGHTNGRSASNGQGVKPVANSGSSPRVVAAGG
jgi:hypothetical protein